ncbi:Vesicle-associated membrane protein 7 [Fukomys damarensis]|uniref:Vesicle-associated membrane protein 7 n=1 Tax=Fukomys damarensis TaxID=885580 RepID=A0A091CKC4_FUKDA|nr:Vesicle-associated membrane protein 7 [Fukomys damarensis]
MLVQSELPLPECNTAFGKRRRRETGRMLPSSLLPLEEIHTPKRPRIEAMAILFAVVARGTTILAKHAWCGGNFLEVTEQILAKIPSENNKLTYSHGNYLFHYICQDRIVYLCITDDDFERSRAFNFLNEVKKRFQTTYGSRAQTALPYAMNSEFSSVLAAQLKHHSENKGLDKVMETQAQVDELKGIMVRNIDLVAQRGERLELLIDKTENLVDSSVTFKTTSRNLARAMCMKNIKLTIIIIIVSIGLKSNWVRTDTDFWFPVTVRHKNWLMPAWCCMSVIPALILCGGPAVTTRTCLSRGVRIEKGKNTQARAETKRSLIYFTETAPFIGSHQQEAFKGTQHQIIVFQRPNFLTLTDNIRSMAVSLSFFHCSNKFNKQSPRMLQIVSMP